MRKILLGSIILVLLGGLARVGFTGSSTVIFNGSAGSILIVTRAPGVALDNFEVTSGGDFSAAQQLITGSPTVIIREGAFSGSGSIRVITDATDPQAQFGVYLASNETGHLAQSVYHGSSVEFMVEAEGSGEGTLEIISTAPGSFDFSFGLIYDYSTMNVLASAGPFNLSWVTFFDQSVDVSGMGRAE